MQENLFKYSMELTTIKAIYLNVLMQMLWFKFIFGAKFLEAVPFFILFCLLCIIIIWNHGE